MTTMPSEDHSAIQELFSPYIDGRASEEERCLVEAHVASCTSCREALEGVRQTVLLLRRVPEVAVPRSFAIPAPEPRGSRFSWLLVFQPLAAATAVLLLALLVGDVSGVLGPGRGFGLAAPAAAPLAAPGAARESRAPAAAPAPQAPVAGAPAPTSTPVPQAILQAPAEKAADAATPAQPKVDAEKQAGQGERGPAGEPITNAFGQAEEAGSALRVAEFGLGLLLAGLIGTVVWLRRRESSRR